MSDAEPRGYVSLQQLMDEGTRVPGLARARRARLRLELIRTISRIYEAQRAEDRRDAASRGIA